MARRPCGPERLARLAVYYFESPPLQEKNDEVKNRLQKNNPIRSVGLTGKSL
jgi:hypothetical protein